ADNLPSWFEALDIVIGEALSAGDVAAPSRAFGLLRDGLAREPTRMGEAVLALMDARILLAERDDPEPARAAADVARSRGHAWPAERAEMLELETQLGIPARDPA